MKDVVFLYNKKRSLFCGAKKSDTVPDSISEPFVIPQTAEAQFPLAPVAVVIPACSEYPGILKTFESIKESAVYAYNKIGRNKSFSSNGKNADSENGSDAGGGNGNGAMHQTLCTLVCVVNNRCDSPDKIKENNRLLLNWAENNAVSFCSSSSAGFALGAISTAEKQKTLSLVFLDCASKGHEMPCGNGVGWARRYGMDWAVLNGARVIACMDADTTVSRSYVRALQDFLLQVTGAEQNAHAPPAGAITEFFHRKTKEPVLQKAINAYEFFIKEHSRRLYKAGTPFYPYALGPSIVCSAWGYASCGGMNMRLSGEDFYFLQSLIKLHIQQSARLHACEYSSASAELSFCDFPLLSCAVYPAARLSQRTLFGTGQKLYELTQNKNAAIPSLLYPDEVYKKIKKLMDFVHVYMRNNDSRVFYLKVKKELPDVYKFFEKEKFFEVWEKIQKQNRKNTSKREAAFYIWFDALKNLRLIHYLMR